MAEVPVVSQSPLTALNLSHTQQNGRQQHSNSIRDSTNGTYTSQAKEESGLNNNNNTQSGTISESSCHAENVCDLTANPDDVTFKTENSDLVNETEAESPLIEIILNNVVATFNTRCHLDLRRIASTGVHVEFRRDNGMLNMKLRRPNATASIWSSGKITCTGATSEIDAKVAARRFARRLQQLGFRVHFCNFRIVNILATCSLPFRINIIEFSRNNRRNASYEPELHPGVTYRIKEPKATLKVFSTGSITVTAPSVENIQNAIHHIFPLVYEFRGEARDLKAERDQIPKIKQHRQTSGLSFRQQKYRSYSLEDADELNSDNDRDTDGQDSLDSDESQD